MKEIIFASGNKGKVREVKKIFSGTEYEIKSLHELGEVPNIVEDGETFFANALIKAKFIYNIYKQPVIADDSGLAVEQLNGAPGVHSARYAGVDATDGDNNAKLLKELKSYKKPHAAKFVCCAVYYNGNEPISALGEIHGRIIYEPRGEKGFGYDPLFIPNGYEITTGEMELEDKNKISHRGKAFNKLKELLTQGGNK